MLKRLVRLMLKLIVGLILTVAGLVFGVLFWLTTDGGGDYVRTQVLDAAAPSFPEGELAIERVEVNLLTGLALRGVEIRDAEGRVLVRLDAFELDYDLVSLTTGTLAVNAVIISAG